jgi:thioredoxin reductase (NADPH)
VTEDVFDVVIVGGGPAGLAAGMYASRARLKAVALERGAPGGQVALTSIVENYPGIDSISGMDLAEALHKQAEKYGMETRYFAVTRVNFNSRVKHAYDESGEDIAGKTVILAMGADHAQLHVPGERELSGRGVSYCAVCDGAFYRDLHVVVIGGGDSAIDEGLYLARICSKVTVVHRRDTLRAERILQERAFADPKMQFIWDTVVERFNGDAELTSLSVRNLKTGERRDLPADGAFIYVGLNPNTGFLKGAVLLDEHGYIPTNERMETNVPGVYAVGDIRPNRLRQCVTAVADGAVAAMQAEKYIGSHWREG